MWAYALLAGAQLVGGYQSADAIRRNGNIRSSINDMNAKFSELDAFNAVRDGQSKAARFATTEADVIGKQRTQMAAQHVDVNYGTAVDVQSDSKLTSMLNVLELQKQGRAQAMGLKMQAINTRLGSQMSELQSQMDASAAENHGFTSALSTGISGYERAQSTGKGLGSKSGSLDTPTWGGASYTDKTKPGGYGSQPAWYFGSNPKPSAQPSSSSLFSDSNWSF